MKQLVSIAALLTCLVSQAQEKTPEDIGRFKLKSVELRSIAVRNVYGNAPLGWLKDRTTQPDSVTLNTAQFDQPWIHDDPGYGLGLQVSFIPRSRRLKSHNRSHEFTVGFGVIVERERDYSYRRESISANQERTERISFTYEDKEINGLVSYSYSHYFNKVRLYGGARVRYGISFDERLYKHEGATIWHLNAGGGIDSVSFEQRQFTNLDAKASHYFHAGLYGGAGFKIVQNLEMKFGYFHEMGIAFVQGGPVDHMKQSHGVEATLLWEFGKRRYKTIDVGEGYNQ